MRVVRAESSVAPYSIQFALSTFDLDPRPGKGVPDAATLDAMKVILPTLPSPAGINHLIFGAPGLDRVDWVVTSYVVTPEPTSALLILLGMAMLSSRRHGHGDQLGVGNEHTQRQHRIGNHDDRHVDGHPNRIE